MGYHDFIKVNLLSYSRLNYKAHEWYKVDFLLDWEEDYAAFFIDGKFIANTWFYTRERDLQTQCDQKFINALMLYTLTPGESSTFKDIRMCNEICPGT